MAIIINKIFPIKLPTYRYQRSMQTETTDCHLMTVYLPCDTNNSDHLLLLNEMNQGFFDTIIAHG